MHLHELLNEEQEPFLLKTYINERRSQLKQSPPKTHLHLKRRNPVSKNPSFSRNLCKNSCFFPSNSTKSSPLFDFPSPTKTPCRKPNNVAALILESALRIQKQKSSKNLRFGFLASILKRISIRKKTQKREICREEIRVSVRDILRWDSFHALHKFTEERVEKAPKSSLDFENEEISEMGFSFSCEKNDFFEDFAEKSMDLESSCSELEDCEEEMRFGGESEGDSRSCEMGFCSSPLRLPSRKWNRNSGFRTPEMSSPVASAPSRTTEVMDSKMVQQSSNDESISDVDKEDDEEKDQFSPVSVLDPPFEDDNDDDNDDIDVEDEVFERSFTNVQRAKQNLLSKIRRFESLAELDPLELEKRIAEEEEEEEHYNSNKGNEKEVDSLLPLWTEEIERFVGEVHSQTSSCVGKFPADIRRLVIDLAKEETEEDMLNAEVLLKACKRIESWKEVALNTIEMTVELDFKRDGDVWRKNHEEVQKTVAEIEFAIFGVLVEELWIDLLQLSNL